jgi:hypothetical protein
MLSMDEMPCVCDLGLRSLVFHGNVGIRQALRFCQPDARRPSRESERECVCRVR